MIKFMNFDRFAFIPLIKFGWWSGSAVMVFIALISVGSAFMSDNADSKRLSLYVAVGAIGLVLFTRLWAEVVLVLFKVADSTTKTAEGTAELVRAVYMPIEVDPNPTIPNPHRAEQQWSSNAGGPIV